MTKLNGPTSAAACYDSWSRSYFDEYYGEKAPYPPVHVKLILDALASRRARTVLDAGCGPASILRSLISDGFEAWGFDESHGMVEQAKHALKELGVPSDRVWQGDASQPAAYRCNAPGAPATFDAAISIGVLPHLQPAQVDAAMRLLHQAVRPGGTVILQARNALFSLFTFNRNTHEFLRDELMPVETQHGAQARELAQHALAEVASRVRMDLPANRGGAGYDDTQPRAENPLTLPSRFAAVGFRHVQTLFYHYHAVPPMCESADQETFRSASVAMESTLGPTAWQGHFLASSFLLVGERA